MEGLTSLNRQQRRQAARATLVQNREGLKYPPSLTREGRRTYEREVVRALATMVRFEDKNVTPVPAEPPKTGPEPRRGLFSFLRKKRVTA